MAARGRTNGEEERKWLANGSHISSSLARLPIARRSRIPSSGSASGARKHGRRQRSEKAIVLVRLCARGEQIEREEQRKGKRKTICHFEYIASRIKTRRLHGVRRNCDDIKLRIIRSNRSDWIVSNQIRLILFIAPCSGGRRRIITSEINKFGRDDLYVPFGEERNFYGAKSMWAIRRSHVHLL